MISIPLLLSQMQIEDRNSQGVLNKIINSFMIEPRKKYYCVAIKWENA